MQLSKFKIKISVLYVLTSLLVSVSSQVWAENVPDFSSIKDVKQKKQAFFDFFRPIIKAINKQRQSERDELVRINTILKSGKQISDVESKKLNRWANRYGIENSDDQQKEIANKLLNHLDQIPESMVLAQAANESAWGTSRFAKHGNNYFGQWCYKKGCGIVPNARDKGTRHEVRRFKSAKESVLAYFQNINSHRTYKMVRDIRASLRAKGEKLSGMKMVAGLVKYSQRREAYVKELRAMIRYNKLES